eukprot:5158612-Prymnesium_polylepis.1
MRVYVSQSWREPSSNLEGLPGHVKISNQISPLSISVVRRSCWQRVAAGRQRRCNRKGSVPIPQVKFEQWHLALRKVEAGQEPVVSGSGVVLAFGPV